MPRRVWLSVYRIVFALLGSSAIVTEVATLSERGRLSPINLFSYFTIEGNVIAVGVLILSTLAIATEMPTHLLAILRGAATLYIVIVGIVFSVLLAGIEGAEFTAVPWDNYVLHYIMPIAVAVDWFVDLPAVRISFREASVWLIYPVAYVLYSEIRGLLVNWYPYPFPRSCQEWLRRRCAHESRNRDLRSRPGLAAYQIQSARTCFPRLVTLVAANVDGRAQSIKVAKLAIRSHRGHSVG